MTKLHPALVELNDLIKEWEKKWSTKENGFVTEHISCTMLIDPIKKETIDGFISFPKHLKSEYIKNLGGFVSIHDENMETSIENVFIAGDAAGIEEASCAMEEGKLVGTAVAQKFGYIDNTEAEDRKKEINQRLEHLRLGSFGDERAEGIKRLIQAKKT